jgi:predicted DNA-binding transcriptional regulator AlpA
MGLAQFITEKDVIEKFNISPPTLWRLRRKGEAPTRYRLSNGCYRYKETEVIAWYEARAIK